MVFQYAKELVRKEGGDPRVVLSAALLLATGACESGPIESQPEQVSNRPEATTKMKAALDHMRFDEDTARRVCHILENCRKGENADAIDFQIVCDSQTLAGLAAEHFAGSSGEWENLIQTSLRTDAARNMARGLFRARPV
jgi:hypothetical protein